MTPEDDDNYFGNLTRAVLGQGVALGWGDEIEAKAREVFNEEPYEQALREIRESYGQFAEENPWTTGIAEFGGAAIPGVAAMMIPGAQPAGAAALTGPATRLFSKAGAKMLGRGAAAGAGVGALSGAGYAEEGERLGPALGGALVGGGLGFGLPLAGHAGKELFSGLLPQLRNRIMPTPESTTAQAGERVLRSMEDAGVGFNDLVRRYNEDQLLGVPSSLSDLDPNLALLAESLGNTAGPGAARVTQAAEKTLEGTKDRVAKQVKKRLEPGDYYEDLDTLSTEMRARANDAYGKAYADGVITDPKALRALDRYMKLPQFQQAKAEAQKILAMEGREFDMDAPTVEMMDLLKRGLDNLIETQTDATTGKLTNTGRILKNSKDNFLAYVDEVSPDYKIARAKFAGDMEMKNAFRTGYDDFGKLDHEQVIKMVKDMSDGEKEAFKTGVGRYLYGKIIDPKGNPNAAANMLGGLDMQKKLMPLFESPAHFKLFKAAMERESQLYKNAQGVVGNSRTAKRQAGKEYLEADNAGEAAINAITGGWTQALSRMAMGIASDVKLPRATASRLADLLNSKKPADVAAAVRILEDLSTKMKTPKTFKPGVKSVGTATGTTGAMWTPPEPESIGLEVYEE